MFEGSYIICIFHILVKAEQNNSVHSVYTSTVVVLNCTTDHFPDWPKKRLQDCISWSSYNFVSLSNVAVYMNCRVETLLYS